MLGILAFFSALGISGTKCAIEDHQMKRDSRTIDEKGNVHYYDRLCRDYINGERVEQIERYDKYGNRHCYTVGMNSKKIYDDSFEREMAKNKELDEREKARCLQYGYNAYNKYDPRFKRKVTTEIDTGKVITCLYEGSNLVTHEKEYRKFYLKPGQGKLDYNQTTIGDEGIKITAEEYKKLNITAPSFSRLPTDSQVLNKLWGVAWFH